MPPEFTHVLDGRRRRASGRVAARRLARGVLALAACTAAAAVPIAAAPPGLVVQPLLRVPPDDLGRDQLTVAFAYAPDGRLFVAEQYGIVKSFDGTRWTEFLDISDEVNSAGDRGLLGIAISPGWTSDRRLCLLYTTELKPDDRDSLAPGGARIVCLQARADDPGFADLGTVRVVLESRPANPRGFRSDSPSHSVGTLRFAPDGTLLASMGEGSGYLGVDPKALRAQSLDDLGGKLLRLDPETGNGVPGNPFFSAAQADSNRSRLIAWGFRNPFRFTVDAPRNRVFVGDVGWGSWEELNVIPLDGSRRHNFGWPCFEGGVEGKRAVAVPNDGYQEDRRTRPACSGLQARDTLPPLAAIEHHGAFGNAIVAGPFYGGTAYPAGYRDRVFVADYAAEELYVVDPANGSATLVAKGIGNVVDLELLPNGNVGFATLPLVGEPGWIYELVSPGSNRPPSAAIGGGVSSAHENQAVTLDASTSSDPEGAPLSYVWDFGDGSPTATGPTVQHAFADPGTYTVRLTVADPGGLRAIAQQHIDVDNTPPAVAIRAPLDGQRYRVGQRVPIRIEASDVEDGGTPRGYVGYQVILHHGGHLHPVTHRRFGDTRPFEAPEHDDDSFLELKVVAQDGGGARAETSVVLRPIQVKVTIASPLAGTVLLVDGQARRAPYTWDATVGGEHEVTLLRSRTGRAVASWLLGRRIEKGPVLRFATPAKPLRITLVPA